MSTKRQNGEGSIFPYRNGFAAYVWIRTPAGRRQRKWFMARLARRCTEVGRVEPAGSRGPVIAKAPTVAQFLSRWLAETVTPNLAPLSAATYAGHTRNYLIPGLGRCRVDRLRVAEVQAWLNRLPTECQCCAQGKDARRAAKGRARCCAVGQCCRQYPSPRTVKDIRTVLRSALSTAVREELVERNVAALVKSPKQRKRKVIPWSSDEARHFLESARDDDDRLYAAYVLVLAMGLRKGEVLGLTWAAVDVDQAVMVVDHQLQRVNRGLMHRETKTEASDADLPMPALVTTALAVRREDQEKERVQAADAWMVLPDGPQFVFTGR